MNNCKFSSTLKKASVLLMVTVLVGCVPARMVRVDSKSEPNMETEAIFAFQAYGLGDKYGKAEDPAKGAITLIFRKEGTQDYFLRMSNNEGPRATHMKAGTYYIHEIQTNKTKYSFPPFEDRGYDSKKDIPIKPFSLKAGEVLYLGTLEISGVNYGQFISGSTNNIDIKVINNIDLAREAIKERYPGYENKITTSLFEKAE